MATRFIEAWLLPPGSLVVVLAAVAVSILLAARRLSSRSGPVAALRRIRRAAFVLVALSLLLYLASMPLISRALIGAAERRVEAGDFTNAEGAAAVVVLGGGLTVLDARVPVPLSALERSGDRRAAQLPADAQARVVEGALIAEHFDLPLVISGGRVFAESSVPTEAEVAASLAHELVSDGLAIITEEKSRSTAENARYVAELLPEATIILVTSAYHMPRALRSFQRAGFTVIAAPVAFRADYRPLHPAQLFPSADALDNALTWLREIVGRLWYTIRGL